VVDIKNTNLYRGKAEVLFQVNPVLPGYYITKVFQKKGYTVGDIYYIKRLIKRAGP